MTFQTSPVAYGGLIGVAVAAVVINMTVEINSVPPPPERTALEVVLAEPLAAAFSVLIAFGVGLIGYGLSRRSEITDKTEAES